MLSKIKEDLLKAGKEEGCLTFKRLNKLLPDEVQDIATIEDIFDFLGQHKIEIVTEEKSGNKRTLTGERWVSPAGTRSPGYRSR